MSIFWIISGILLVVAAIWLGIRPYMPAAIAAYAAMWAFRLGGVIHPTTWMLSSWGIVTAIVVMIDVMQPRAVSRATNGLVHMSVGAMVGMALGMVAVSWMWVVCGAFVCSALGAMVYSRTPSGRYLGFPSQRFLSYTLAKCLPLTAAYGMLGVAGVMAMMALAPEYSIQHM